MLLLLLLLAAVACLFVCAFVCLFAFVFGIFMVAWLRFLDEGQPLFLETRHLAPEKSPICNTSKKIGVCVCVFFFSILFLDSITEVMFFFKFPQFVMF